MAESVLDVLKDIRDNGLSSTAGIQATTETYTEVTSVASATLTTVTTYTVPALKKFYLYFAACSGTNIAEWTVELNSVVIAKQRTYFGGDLNTVLNFGNGNSGLELAAADVVRVRVEHNRPDVGDFNARIVGVLQDA